MQPTSSASRAAQAVQATPASRGRRGRRRRGVGWVLLVLYGIVLAGVAFWPVPVDSGMDGLLDSISEAVPWLTYDLIEVAANVVLFIPLGILLTMMIHRHRWLVVVISLGVTGSIEWLQAQFLDERTSSAQDVAANMLGAVIGMGIVVIVEVFFWVCRKSLIAIRARRQ